MFSWALLASDIVTLALAWACSYIIRFVLTSGAEQGLLLPFIGIGIFHSMLTTWFFARVNHYTKKRISPVEIILTTIKGNAKAISVLIIFLYFLYPDRLSRGFLIIYIFISTIFFIFQKLTLRPTLWRLNKKKDRIILVGNNPALLQLAKDQLQQKEKYNFTEFIGWVHPPENTRISNIPTLDTNQLTTLIPNHSVDAFYLSYNEKDKKLERDFLNAHLLDSVPIRILIETPTMLLGHSVRARDGLISIDLNQVIHPPHQFVLKRMMDFILSGAALILLSPFFLLIAILVKLSSRGPIFYSQERIGKDEKIFRMWKFRSMKPAQNNEDTTEWVYRENQRRTKIGDFLRKTSLDELPQLFNIFVGDMSLIGPRPERPFFVEKFKKEIPGYVLRHKMPVGLSGWAQINGLRGDTSISERIEYDIYYIKNWSLWLDLQIIFLTLWKSLIDKNA